MRGRELGRRSCRPGIAGWPGGAPRRESPGSLRLSPPALPAPGPAGPGRGELHLPLVASVLFFLRGRRRGLGGRRWPRFSRGPLTSSPPPACPGSVGRWGCAPRALGSPSCIRALSCPRRGDLGGCSPGADALRARLAYSLPQVDGGARERLPGAASSPFGFTRIWGSDRLLNRGWSLGLGRAWSPGMQRIPRFPPRLCLSPVISVL